MINQIGRLTGRNLLLLIFIFFGLANLCLAAGDSSNAAILLVDEIPYAWGQRNYLTAIKGQEGFWHNNIKGTLYHEQLKDGHIQQISEFQLYENWGADYLCCAPTSVLSSFGSEILIQPMLNGKIALIDEKSNRHSYFDAGFKIDKYQPDNVDHFTTSAVIQHDGTLNLISAKGTLFHLHFAPNELSLGLLSKPQNNHRLPSLKPFMRIDVDVPHNPIKTASGNLVFVLREFRTLRNGQAQNVDFLCVQTPDGKCVKETVCDTAITSFPTSLVGGPENEDFVYGTADCRIHFCDANGDEIVKNGFNTPRPPNGRAAVMSKSKVFALLGDDDVLRIYDLKSHRQVANLQMQSGSLPDVCVTDATTSLREYFVLGSKDGDTQFVDSDGKPCGIFKSPYLHAPISNVGSGLNLIPSMKLRLVQM